ncbi:MAG: phage/plasmid primase, P4 family [Ruminococcus sp.]|nr:phage/plasmid primase, P4 family [Ruminococcus sp.]
MNDNFMELKEQKIWLCWNFREKDGKRTKVPIAASGEKTGTDEAHSSTWVTFDEAKRAAAEKNYSGVGFVIPKGYFFLDIDHRDMDDPYIKMMLVRFGSYAEKSVSREGLHIYGKCDFTKVPTEEKNGKLKLHRRYYQKNPNNGTELYMGGLTNRFAVFTENIVQDKPLRDCTNAVLVTLEKNMKRKRDVSSGAPFEKAAQQKRRSDGAPKRGSCAKAFDERMVRGAVQALRLQKNGGKFSKLFDEGDFSDYGSHSEADLALCSMIAFRVGNDIDAIDKIFRQSALYREKWERRDYREETLSKGIEACSGTFHSSPAPCPDFIRFNETNGQPYVVVPALAQHVRDNMKYLLVRDSGKHGLLKYVYEGGVYKLYADEMFKGCIKQFVEDYDPELVKINQINEAFQHIITDRNYIGQDDLNSHEDIINFRNGLLVVTADRLELIPHTPDLYSTIQIPCDWMGERRDTPVFSEYIKTLTNGDKDTARLLMQFMGACLSNIKGWRMKKSLFLVGDGNTGKSQLKSLVEKMLGKGNYTGIDLSEIEARFGTGTIYGTRLAGSSDMSFMTVGELKAFKLLTGGDSVFAEFKGLPAFEYKYSGLLWFCMNRLPKFGGDDGKWVYDRIMVVNCPNVIPPEKQDKMLLEKMYAEREGIIYLAVKALQKVIKNGYFYDEPETVTQAREKYMSENNTVISFFEECMTRRLSDTIRDKATTGKVYEVYRAWCCDNNGGFAKTAKEFRETLANHLDTTFEEMTKRVHGNRYYTDYTLTLEAKQQYARVYGYDDSSTGEDDFLA